MVVRRNHVRVAIKLSVIPPLHHNTRARRVYGLVDSVTSSAILLSKNTMRRISSPGRISHPSPHGKVDLAGIVYASCTRGTCLLRHALHSSR